MLALALSGCSRHAAEPPATAPGPAPPPAAASPPAAAPAAAPVQSATEQARGAQESADGGSDKPESSDASLERLAALPKDEQLPAGRWKPGVNYDPVVPGQPTSVEPGKVEVIEVMWLGCPHCYALEPALQACS